MSVEVPEQVRVLNVNDDLSSRYVASKVLRRAGFEVVEAETGLGAVRQARLYRPHVAVLDVRLPDISGIEVCRTIKSDPDTASVLVVQTSASFVTSADRTHGLNGGADAYLAQPFESAELVATIHSLLRGRRMEVEALQRAEALAQADQRKDEFLAMLAHELRNPLSAILTASRLLQTRDAPPTPRLAATIERQAHNLASLVDDLLDISRITHGKIQLKRTKFDLREAVTRAVETCRPAFDRRRQELRVLTLEQALPISADPVRIEQILGNLLSNAAKYSPERGRITVTLRHELRDQKPWGYVDVADDGVGLSPEDASRIFDLFYQVDASLARSQSGLGIGLTMAKRLVDLHQGVLEVESEGHGKGARFSLGLPEVTANAEANLPAEASPADLRGARIFLVDDNVDACELMQWSLENAGCKVTTASDGGEALRILTEQRFDVAVLDIGLPVLDGYQLASAVLESLGSLRPKLVALTGYGRSEDRSRALRAGFDEHLVKPIEPEALAHVIGNLLKTVRVRLG